MLLIMIPQHLKDHLDIGKIGILQRYLSLQRVHIQERIALKSALLILMVGECSLITGQDLRQRQEPNELVIGQNLEREVSILLICKQDRKSTRLNSSHQIISYAVFCLKKK